MDGLLDLVRQSNRHKGEMTSPKAYDCLGLATLVLAEESGGKRRFWSEEDAQLLQSTAGATAKRRLEGQGGGNILLASGQGVSWPVWASDCG